MIAFGGEILEIVPGRVSTEVDARLSFDVEATIQKARYLIGLLRKGRHSAGANPYQDRFDLEELGLQRFVKKKAFIAISLLCFLWRRRLLCAEAGVTLISPFVGRIYDYYKKTTGKEYVGADDPGVQSVRKIYTYYKNTDTRPR